MKPDPKTTVSLESLLQLKRSERPPEEFWTQFESELRAKQLAAIVDRRPWWSPFERMSLLLVRRSAPVGAAAALAVALLGFHEYRVHVITSSIPSAPLAQPESATPATEGVAAPIAAIQTGTLASNAGETTESLATTPEDAKVVVAPSTAAKPASADVNVDPFSGASVTPGQPAQLVALRAPSFERLQAPAALVSPASFSATSAPVDPLARMTAPSDDRRSIYLNDALPGLAGQSDEATVTPTRVASRLSDERLYEQIRRLGVGGDRLQIRF